MVEHLAAAVGYALSHHWEPVLAILSSLVIIITGIFGGWWTAITRYVVKFGEFVRKSYVPNETIRAVPTLQCHWQPGSYNNLPCIFFNAQLYVTNINDAFDIIITDAILNKYKVPAQLQQGVIAPRKTVRSLFHFTALTTHKNGKDILSSVTLTDQLGNQHTAKKVVFRPLIPSTAPQPQKPVLEALHSISNPVEHQVAAVLQAEIARYEICDRSVGGLGSVRIKYRGREMVGMGADWITLGSPENQLIVDDPQNAELISDNLDKLVDLYGRLSNDGERATFIDALLSRMRPGSGYEVISYFIVAVMWRIGRLGEALTRASATLTGATDNALGNVFMFIDGMLKYKPDAWVDGELASVEKVLSSSPEQFRIRQRIAAIQTGHI